jgi:C4-dicarboxylate transporter DctQ subunit
MVICSIGCNVKLRGRSTLLFSSPNKMGDGRQRLVGVITMLILVWFSLYVTYFGWTIFHDSFERGRTTGSLLDLPAWIAELPVPLLFAFVSVQALIEIFKLISGDPIPSGGHE